MKTDALLGSVTALVQENEALREELLETFRTLRQMSDRVWETLQKYEAPKPPKPTPLLRAHVTPTPARNLTSVICAALSKLYAENGNKPVEKRMLVDYIVNNPDGGIPYREGSVSSCLSTNKAQLWSNKTGASKLSYIPTHASEKA